MGNIALCTAGPSVVRAWASDTLRAEAGPFDAVVSVNFAACHVKEDWMVAGDAICYTEQDWRYHRPRCGYVCLYKTAELEEYPDESIPDLIRRVDGRDPDDFEVIDWSALPGPAAFSFTKAFGLIFARLVGPGSKVWVFGCDWSDEPCIDGRDHHWTDRRARREVRQTMAQIQRIRDLDAEVYRARINPLRWELFDAQCGRE